MELRISEVVVTQFRIEELLERQSNYEILDFTGMDKSRAAACNRFIENNCAFGDRCPYQHINVRSSTVCKHYLNGLCKKGDNCEFLHQYDMSKMPDCYFYTRYGECQNDGCPYTHPKNSTRLCPWYERGFCSYGPGCDMKHERKVVCINYMNGFCPQGSSECENAHPRWFFSHPDKDGGGGPQDADSKDKQRTWICRHCNEPGHKIQFCRKLSEQERNRIIDDIRRRNSGGGGLGGANVNPLDANSSGPKMRPPPRPLSEIVCYKCSEKGHYANHCTNRSNFNFLKP